MFRIRHSVLLLSFLLLIAASSCSDDGRPEGAAETPGATTPGATTPADSSPVAAAAKIRFEDITSQSGIDFVHDTGFDSNYWFPEIVGPGCAIFDFDNDGREDLFFVDGGSLTPGSDNPPGHRLYRNLGDGAFSDVTAQAGLAEIDGSKTYGQGCAVADYDGDGYLDLYLTVVGPNQLFRNRGDGTFEEVGLLAGVAGQSWSTSASFADLDQDGDLDLYVANYCLWSPAGQVPCQTPAGDPDYCNPKAFEPAPDVLLLSRGDGTFEDVSQSSGIVKSYGRGLGVVVADYDGDDDPDIYVANDGDPNTLWLNQGDGMFRDDGLMSGSALNAEGNTEASMGVAVTDLESDGDWDIFMTHMTGETNTLYLNDGSGIFEDATGTMLGAPSMPFTGFGTGFLDADLDGDEDLFVANGAVIKSAEAARGEWPYAQRDQFFVASGRRELTELDTEHAPWLAAEAVGRGTAFGDLDNDGDTDIVVANAAGPPRLLRNESVRPGRWIGVALEQSGPNREAVGALVFARSGMNVVSGSFMKRVSRDGSFASANDVRVVFGLPADDTEVRLAVQWPSGEVELWAVERLDRYVPLRKGSGTSGRLEDLTSGASLSPAVPVAGLGVVDLGLTRSTEIPPLPELETVDPKVATRIRTAFETLGSDVSDAVAWKAYGLALYADAGDDESAKIVLEQAIVRAPSDVRSIYLLAILEERLGAPVRTRAYLERASELDPSYTPIALRLAALDVDGGDLEGAESLYRSVLANEPDNYDALEGLGRVLRLKDKAAEGVTLLQRAVELAPNSRGAQYELGLIHRALGQSNEARVALETASRLPKGSLRDPWLEELFEGRGGDRALLTDANQARQAGDLVRAARLYEEYVRARPDDPIGWINAAAARRDRAETDSALTAIDRALALTPTDARALALKGSIFLDSRQFDVAQPFFAKATKADPSMAQAWLDRSTAEQGSGDSAAAIRSLQTYLGLRPRDGSAFFRLGEILVRQSDFEAAKAAYAQAIEADPNQSSAHYRLGGLALRASDPASAIVHFKGALEGRPNWVEAFLGLGHAYRAAGQIPEARASLERGLRLSPGAKPLQQLLDQLPSP